MATTQPASLKEELERDIDHHRKWGSRDFAWAQIFVWIGIIASTAASLHAAEAYDLDRLSAAILAAVPGAVLVVERTFKFASRASWHTLYMASLQALYRKIRDENQAASAVSPEKSKLDIEMEKMFPPLDSAAIGGQRP